MGYPLPAVSHLHRKVWEWSAISQALLERGCLQAGKRGIGFAVGNEPLVSLFADAGVRVDATDLAAGEMADVWNETAQHANSKDGLFMDKIVERETFENNVTFYNADMNNLDGLNKAGYDFAWSSCAMEHLGTLDAGLEFVKNAMDLLKPGGVACHTTEFNISSNDATIESGINVLYRKRDLEKLEAEMRMKYCCVEQLDLFPGTHADDVMFDIAPYGQNQRPHIKLLMDGYITTSLLLICRKHG
ncbi:SAM-dependent methyltransferase [Sphingomonas sp. R86521]|uniref:SAM-dependent methyltransferase n=1 Tax=Sphingomonas sp. R86521 TaxID=3093860 RepID=UPI0036D32FBB